MKENFISSVNLMDIEKMRDEPIPNIKNCPPKFPFGSSLAKSFGVSSGSKSAQKGEESCSANNWNEYLNQALNKLKSRNSFEFMRTYSQNGSKNDSFPTPEIVPINLHYDEIYRSQPRL